MTQEDQRLPWVQCSFIV